MVQSSLFSHAITIGGMIGDKVISGFSDGDGLGVGTTDNGLGVV